MNDLVRELREAYLASDRRFCLHADLLARAAAALDGLPGPNETSLFRDRTAESAAWQCAMMFAQATEWLLEIHSDGWKYLPLRIKRPMSERIASLVYHCRDLNVRPTGLEGKDLPRLAYAYQHPGFYGEQVNGTDATGTPQEKP